MGVLEKITANKELTELKKFKFQKAILTLMLEWKHLEEYMDSTQHSFQECLHELQLKEKYLNSVQESAVESNKEMESIRVSIEEKIKELDDKERDFLVFRDEQVNELGLKEKQLGLIGKSIQERIKLAEMGEEKFAAKQKFVEGIFEEFKVEEKRFEDSRKSVEKRIEDINSKEMQLDKRSKELDAKEEDIKKRFKELDSKEKKFYDRVREIELMAKQISNVVQTMAKTELQPEDILVNSSIDIQFFTRMDGKGLQSFLNQLEKDHNSVAEEVYQALQLSPDPAKLVLDAMEGFYPTHPNKGNGEFKVAVIRRSCLLLLEQLLRISPQLQPQVKMDAMELLLQWKSKLSSLPDSVEVLGLLFLLAAYNLPMPFAADELSVLVEIVAEHRQTSELCRILGLTDSIPGRKAVKHVRKKTAIYQNDASAHPTELSKEKAGKLPKVAFSEQGCQAPQKSKDPVPTKTLVAKATALATPSNPAANQTGKKRQAADSSHNSNRSVRLHSRGGGRRKNLANPRKMLLTSPECSQASYSQLP